MTKKTYLAAAAGVEVPQAPLDEATREYNDLPATFRAIGAHDVHQQFLFDPATLHHRNAYRAGDPEFSDPARGAVWRVARRRALFLALAAIADSPWVESLVLRGSVAMALWLPAAAREPGDLDFVVVPPTQAIDHAASVAMLAAIPSLMATFANGQGGGIDFDASLAVLGDIWTYDRVPGRRLVLPWSVAQQPDQPDQPELSGLPGGNIQLDFVFNEVMPQEPELVELPGGGVVQAASPALSLAWKLLWLFTDTHPQGKDLYDAVLLAEHYPLPDELLRWAFEQAGQPSAVWHARTLTIGHLPNAAREAQLEHLVLEYPQLREVAPELAGRLVRALSPGSTGSAGSA
ncbi:nucleotidyl transferase AbiEii/AbiGii toxin family protein [Kineosporia sp. NBRC 101731]|uniref:nucleotidyl transferase AbiEii/AbiGii toxin family protein n=1 Tax=Kineosporia sp. NBRC 101731 TaxID=3032199 RepID=UPI0024A3295D|nr:nucleotidyl transferase AbiEii/AbiGii toxin family protein [Kineosporia sp. NBRC 101731]GLY30891.1 hypothetical protein Kisp02_42560 [Kineosporia sp. NBRC 101731]